MMAFAVSSVFIAGVRLRDLVLVLYSPEALSPEFTEPDLGLDRSSVALAGEICEEGRLLPRNRLRPFLQGLRGWLGHQLHRRRYNPDLA